MVDLSALIADGPLLLDGGMGTLLQERGLTTAVPGSSGTLSARTRSAPATRSTRAPALGC
jgi:methionine synthase I (cobalamin-dependent)